ncbi:tRNA(Ile)-lysidine synthase [Jannaschia pagri]|uniref:tRNA(Ile)-lysidine synthase n=1 Tax=Jannaschia pagri TaxID=2829797 RepID=A0ABQ4NIT0_9RHOB|nr:MULTISPECIES: tRNA lysidine(34) synthetase TilS [unclassified Jannaschia]GIT89876.1 tRNA(Ile)-lysidine synthase [Jannaschia sp. AI_61]GIT94017.1 tRNA(Ile)-lysidine synthase [Jannaschia sp. AI_62]
MAVADLGADGTAGIGIAVSGGADSLALLLTALDGDYPIRAVTIDHGLRSGSAHEAALVAQICAARGIGHDTVALSLQTGSDLQNRARQARYRALAQWAQEYRLTAVWLGHTASDIAETFLMRMSDGVGLDGLAAMDAAFTRHGMIFQRPLLHLTRDDTAEMVRAAGLRAVQDPSNEDKRFERVRMRDLLAQAGLPVRQIARSAQALRDVQRSVARQTDLLFREIATLDHGDVILDQSRLTAMLRVDPEQARRVTLRALQEVTRAAYPPRHGEQIELMRRVAAGQATTLAGCLVTSGEDTLRLSREPAAATRAPEAMVGTVWDNRWRVTGPPASVRALGDDIGQTPWRDTGLPRRSLMASPGIWRGGRLCAAPLAGWAGEWTVSYMPVEGRHTNNPIDTANPPTVDTH